MELLASSHLQEAQLLQRGHVMLRVTEYFVKSLKVIQNDTFQYSMCKY